MSLICAIPLVASFFSACAPAAPLAVGYVEGDFVQLAPIEVAQVQAVSVRRGERIETGQKLVILEDSDAKIAVSQSEAALDQAKAQLADLQVGRRPEEIAVLDAALASAEAQAEEARRVVARTNDLRGRGVAAQANLDQAQTSLETAQAQVGEARANLNVAKLPAREETIKAAENQVKQAEAALEQARWRLSKRVLNAPSAGRVDDVVRNPGDTAGPSAPVLSLLPDGAVRLKLYLPETRFSSIKVGSVLDVRCDGCPEGLKARVSYVSPDPEFTPPVIYSLETRQKLVYLIEALPEGEASPLQPGQIVDVSLAEGAE
ncbi:HlyD family efflux transporter periplasmic adaptor subunit [Mesorhizobium sp. SB112]|uniref:HlyD family secretion protein n=1 Tax=Mesorhizobium sp. SB112 TaxID=3151853 RepID=UPI0032647796